MGCSNGVDVWVTHSSAGVTLFLDDTTETVSEEEWTEAVLGFAKPVSDFYRRSSPKCPIKDEEDRRGWAAFWEEWDERVAAAAAAASGDGGESTG